jgi:uncharacterized protein YndB with AHSA1/START domain
MSKKPDPVVRVTRYFPFSAERVFDAWLDPALAARWLFTTPGGQNIRAEVDARVGGRYTFTDRRESEDIEHTGEYLEIDRPRRLVFTFGVPKYSPDFVRVTIEISPRGNGCELVLTQTGTPSEWISRTQDGWTQILGGLAVSLGDRSAAINREPGRYVAAGEVQFVRLLPGPIERVWAYLTDGEKRAKWLAGGPMDLRVGGRTELLFRHADIAPEEEPPEKYREVHETGHVMIGEVTQCDPPRRLSYTWDEGSEVTFELTPRGDEVELLLTHRRLKSGEELKSVSAGWHTHMGILTALLSDATPPPFWAMHSRLEADYAARLEQSRPAPGAA